MKRQSLCINQWIFRILVFFLCSLPQYALAWDAKVLYVCNDKTIIVEINTPVATICMIFIDNNEYDATKKYRVGDIVEIIPLRKDIYDRITAVVYPY